MSLGEKAGGESGAEAIACLTPEAANIEVAILRRLDESAAETAIRAALGFGEFARFAGLGITTALERAANAAQTQGAIDLTAWCFYRLGDIALRRSDDDTARTHYEAARPLYQRVGDLLGEANCIRGLGDIALRRSDDDTARTHFDAALAIYERIPEPYSIGWAHRRRADCGGRRAPPARRCREGSMAKHRARRSHGGVNRGVPRGVTPSAMLFANRIAPPLSRHTIAYAHASF
jgi:hypothetical protein